MRKVREKPKGEESGVYPAPKTAAARGLNRTLAARGTAPPPLI